MHPPRYKDTAADNFWSGVTENAFKWANYERANGTVEPARTAMHEEYLDWAAHQTWSVFRGHALEWLFPNYAGHFSRLEGCDMYRYCGCCPTPC